VIFLLVNFPLFGQIVTEQEWQSKYDQTAQLKIEKKWADYTGLIKECYAFAKANFSETDQRREEVTYKLSELYRSLKAYEQALPLCEETFVLTRNIYGENHSNYITALNDWGFVLMHTGKHMDALNKFAVALKKFDNNEHEAKLRTAILENADWSLQKLIFKSYVNSKATDTKKREDIHTYLLESFKIRKELYAPCSPELRKSAEAIGLIREELKLKDEAIEAYQYIAECTLTNGEGNLGDIYERLASLHLDQGNYSAAADFRIKDIEAMIEKGESEGEEFWLKVKNSKLSATIAANQEQLDKVYSIAYDQIKNSDPTTIGADYSLILETLKQKNDQRLLLDYSLSKLNILESSNAKASKKKSVYKNAIEAADFLFKEKKRLALLEEVKLLIDSNNIQEEDIFLLNTEAEVWIKYGQSLQAQAVLNSARKWLEKHNQQYREAYANNLSLTAELNQLLGNYELAAAFHEKAIDYLVKNNQRNTIQFVEKINRIAKCRTLMDQEEESQLLYNQALGIIKNIPSTEEPAWLIQKATSLDGLGRYSESTELYKKAIQMAAQKDDLKTKPYLENQALLANHYLNAGSFSKSIEQLENLIENSREMSIEKSIDLARYHYSLAEAYFLSGEFKKAIDHYNRSLSNRFVKNVKKYSVSIGDYSNFKLCYYKLGEQGEFISALENEIDRFYADIDRKFPYLSEQQRFAYLQSHADQINEIKKLVINGEIQDPKLDNLLAELVNNLKGLLVTSNREALESLAKTADPQIQQLFKDYRAVKQNAVNSNSTNDQFVDWWQNSALVFGIDFNSAIGALYAKGKDVKFTSNQWQNDLEKLSKNEAVIMYDHFIDDAGQMQYYALSLKSSNDLVELIKIGPEDKIQEAIVSQSDLSIATRGSISKSKKKDGEGSLSEVYDLVWSPIEKSLIGIDRVYLLPDGLLHNLPFSILPSDDQLLLEKYDLVQITSLKSLSGTQENIDFSSALLMGGVDYGSNGSSNSTWDDLPGTATEVKTISEKLNKNNITYRLLIETQATEDAFKEIEADQPDILHIATHGFFNNALSRREVYAEPDEVQKQNESTLRNLFTHSDEPLNRSGLILAGGNRGYVNGPLKEKKNDGVLTALEITNLDLSGVRLAVLSACNTALGDIKANEGVYGLQRSLKMAGVDHLLISLWEVPDKETVEFMEFFYDNLFEQKSIQNAFKATQLNMMNRYPDDLSKWAAFILLK
jgi:CHAT domain-containing protein